MLIATTAALNAEPAVSKLIIEESAASESSAEIVALNGARYTLPADERLFTRALELEFFVRDNRLHAREINGIDAPAARVLIHDLQWKSGEYVYGHIEIPGRHVSYRCKLWRRGAVVYLRIYETNRYSTHRLVKR
ncbi:MAG: hypothetical protein KDK34_05775 [Leptospiraceae bacterium]|nr:hypothetical protein [Leptospiraceae bacterium]